MSRDHYLFASLQAIVTPAHVLIVMRTAESVLVKITKKAPKTRFIHYGRGVQNRTVVGGFGDLSNNHYTTPL